MVISINADGFDTIERTERKEFVSRFEITTILKETVRIFDIIGKCDRFNRVEEYNEYLC